MTDNGTAPAQFTAEQWQRLRTLLGSTPYSAAVATPSSVHVDSPDKLFAWLESLAEVISYYDGRRAKVQAERDEAHRIINAGRLALATLMQPVGTPLITD